MARHGMEDMAKRINIYLTKRVAERLDRVRAMYAKHGLRMNVSAVCVAGIERAISRLEMPAPKVDYE